MLCKERGEGDSSLLPTARYDPIGRSGATLFILWAGMLFETSEYERFFWILKMDRRLASKLAFRGIPGIGTGKTGDFCIPY